MTLCFVYGTLKGMKTRFGPGSDLQASEFVGHAVTHLPFCLIDGIYPIALHQDDIRAKPNLCGKILGEVYAVQPAAVAALDAYEGYPDLYTRSKIRVNLLKGGSMMAWIYTGTGARNMIGHPGRDYIVPNASGELYWHFDTEVPLPNSTE